MKKLLIFLVIQFCITKIYSQVPKADFEVIVTYYCDYAFVELKNNSTNADSCFWDIYGYGNYVFNNIKYFSVGNLDWDRDFTFSLIAKGHGSSDTLTKPYSLRQTTAAISATIQDTLNYAPLVVKFTNLSKTREGDTLTYSWDFNDGTTSLEVSPTHVYELPKTYYPVLTATTQSNCKLHGYATITVKDTAQKGEVGYIINKCTPPSPHGWDNTVIGYNKYYGWNNYLINDTLKVFGQIYGICCTRKTATVHMRKDTVYIRTFETGPECSCSDIFCFALNIPLADKDSINVSFNGSVVFAKKIYQDVKTIHDDETISIYPNPTKNSFSISYLGVETKYVKIELIDLLGRIVFRTNQPLKDRMTINNLNLQSGTYILRLTTLKGDTYTSKIIIN